VAIAAGRLSEVPHLGLGIRFRNSLPGR
jgi:hypothetical protein